MKILTTKIFRDIWSNKFRSLSIVLVISFTLMLLAGLRAGHPVLFNTYDYNLEYYNVADGTFSFSEPIVMNNISSIQSNTSFMTSNQINSIEGRIHYLTDIIYKEEIFQAVIYGINYPNEVNQLVIEKRSSDIPSNNVLFESNSSCIIETHFAGNVMKFLGHDVNLNDEISINFPGGRRNFTIKGIAQDSYYSYMVDEVSKMPLLGNLAVIWIDLEVAQELRYENNQLINQVLFTVEERFNKDQILKAADELSYFFGNEGITPSGMKFTIFDESDEYLMFKGDAGAIDKMGTIFGIIGLIVCVVIIFNTLSKMVYAQRRNIGLFLSMGSPRRKILFHYAGITLILTSIGILIGIPLAYGLALGMSQMVIRMLYGFHQIALTIPILEFVYGALSTFSVCFFCSVLSAWSITTVTPREAMSTTFSRITKIGKNFAEKALSWIPIFKSIYMIVPLRELFLKKKKSLITIFALITSMIFLVDSLAMGYNVFAIMMKNFDDYNTYDVQVILENPVSIAYVNHILNDDSKEALSGINHHEICINLFTKFIHNGEVLSWTELVCYQENSSLRTFNVIKGGEIEKSDLNKDEVLLGVSIAGEYDIELNDEIKIGILGNYSVEVKGFVGELIDYSILWTYEALQESGAYIYFGFPASWTNGILFTVDNEVDLKSIREEFESSFNIAFWIESDTARKATLAFMQSLIGMMLLFLGVGIFIGVIFSFQSMYMAFVDRHHDFLAFKAMGTRIKYIRRIIFWENAILSFISLILTIPFGYLFYIISVNYVVGDNFYLPKTIPWFTWPMVLILSFLSLWLATGRLLRKIKKMNLPDELRQVGIT
jgi:putative ABC transport system permease protein